MKESYVLQHQQARAHIASSERTWAGIFPRLAALLIDWFIVVLALIPVLLALGFVGDPLGSVGRLSPMLESSFGAVLGTLYFAAWEASPWRGTPGKKLLALTVQGSAGERIGMLRSIWRNVCKHLSGLLFPVAFCLVAFSQERRCLHDYMAGTWVARPRR